MLTNIFNKIKTALSYCLEHSEIYAPPRKMFIGSVFDVNISIANVMNILTWVIVVTLICLSEYGIIPANKVGFYCKDPLLSHKYNGDTVTPLTLGVTALLLPLMMILATEMLIHQSFRKINVFTSWLLFKEGYIGTMAVLFLTSMAKVLLGEHRPHFFDVCEPDSAKNCTEGSFVETFSCTSTKYSFYEIFDSSISFPSGHSSISWFIGMFCSFIVHARLPTINAGTWMKPFLISVCLTWSLVCSLTRITDRRHHWWDVLAGSTFGILASLYSISLVRRKLPRIQFDAETDSTEESIEMV